MVFPSNSIISHSSTTTPGNFLPFGQVFLSSIGNPPNTILWAGNSNFEAVNLSSGSGTTYTANNGVQIIGTVISAKIDGTSVILNGSQQLSIFVDGGIF